ncbi:MAG: methyltransferase domain-containing protein [Patescibacteria group bacterium]
MQRIRERINFLKVFKADKHVGALAPSSRFVVESVIKHVPKGVKTIVECGPGEGVLTQVLMKLLPQDGTLLAIESNKEFVAILQGIHNPRLKIVEGRAQDIIRHVKNNHLASVDFAVASIPFSFITPLERTQIVRDVYAVLRPQGVFVIFNYSPLMYRTMKKVFGNVSLGLELRNILPCSIMVSRKGK